MDRRKFNRGTPGNKGGRPPKADEIALIEKLDEFIDKDRVIQILEALCLEGNIKAITLYMNYRYGRPKESMTMTVNKETPILTIE